LEQAIFYVCIDIAELHQMQKTASRYVLYLPRYRHSNLGFRKYGKD